MREKEALNGSDEMEEKTDFQTGRVVVVVGVGVAGRRESSRFCPKNMLIKLQRAKVCLLVTRLS